MAKAVNMMGGAKTRPPMKALGRPRKNSPLLAAINNDDRAGVMERLEVSGALPKLLDALKADDTLSIQDALRITATPTREFLSAYYRGQGEMAKEEAMAEFAGILPALAKDLKRNALDKKIACNMCLGTGVREVVKKLVRGSAPIKFPCKTCQGSGSRWLPSGFKRWAAENILKVNKLIDVPGGFLLNVNQQTAIVGGAAASGESLFTRVLRATDEILYPSPERKALPAAGTAEKIEEAQVIEAECIPKE